MIGVEGQVRRLRNLGRLPLEGLFDNAVQVFDLVSQLQIDLLKSLNVVVN